ncbi:patched domain-containing protein 3 isoform 1-T1 [Synchiropus picturatus]
MARCYTDCIERPFRLGFEIMGAFVGVHPWWFLITPLVFSAGLGSGFYFLPAQMSNNIEDQFTPVDGQAKVERQYIQETFPMNTSMFSSLRLSTSGCYATLIASTDWNVLAEELLQEILDLDFKIRSMPVEFNQSTFSYEDVCARVAGSCFSNDILEIIEQQAGNITTLDLTYPWFKNTPLHLSLGGVHANNSVVKRAEAMQLRYYLTEADKQKAELWLEGFIHLVSNQSAANMELSYSTSASMQWEFEKTPTSVISLFSITYVIVISFSILSSWRQDNVRTKVWVACCGVLSTGLAVLSGFGALLLLGQPFVIPVASCPFMILGVGLDDMFIMVSCWQRTRVLASVPDRLAHTYRDSAVSISVTTLTNALALYLGCSSSFGSVRSFCLYAGVSVCFCYLYCLTFLGACLALNGQREAQNMHWFTCARIPEDAANTDSKTFNVCCIGGSYNRITETEESECVSRFFERFYGPFLTHKFTKAAVIAVYTLYLAVSIYGCITLKEGLDVKHLALDDSYLIDYYHNQKQYFFEYSYNIMVAVKQPVSYWDEIERNNTLSCLSKFESLDYVNSTSGWFFTFQSYIDVTNITKEDFQSNLIQFLDYNSQFHQDLNWSEGGTIQSSRFFIQLQNRATTKDMMMGLRKTAEECSTDLLVYHPAFIYFDQYTVIVQNTVQTVLVAVFVMLTVSLILIPSPVCSLWVAFAVCSVIVGVTGLMSLWGVNLDSISMINLIMCVGFSVDFSAHISYSFISSPKRDVNAKAMDALAHLGYPILQGALSTVLGVVVLSTSGSYIFRTFFKIVFLVITCGTLHGLVFIPVFLTLLGAWR